MTSLPADYADFDEPVRDPPENDSGEFVCARRCCDGTRCMTQVPFPYLSCYQHDRSDPILWDATGSDRSDEITSSDKKRN